MVKNENFLTSFSDDDVRNIIVDVCYSIYSKIDFSKIKGKRLMGIWDELYSKIKRSATSSNRFQFFEVFADLCGVRMPDLKDKTFNYLQQITDVEFLSKVRDEAHTITVLLRMKSKDKDHKLDVKKEKLKTYNKTFELIPCISGNSIRGVLRRLAMYDFLKRVGCKKIDKQLYHILFTGGALTESTLYEDLEKREKLIDSIPMLGVFGSAIGNMTIEGQLSVGFAYPKCVELKTGINSFWSYLDMIFQSRKDSSKDEKNISIKAIKDKKDENPTHMKYEYEVFAKGTQFNHGFRMMDFNELSVSAFWHALILFKENPFIGGMFATGSSEIDLSELTIPENANNLYLRHIEKNKKDILAFIGVKENEK